MRVIAGKARGLTLETIEGDSTRPTRDVVKEALFSILMNYIPDSRFLDLFAGSGAIGIEALSRGAASAMFVDLNSKCTQVIKRNLEKAKFSELAEVYNTDYKKAINKMKPKSFDVIYVDPPYNREMGIDAITRLYEADILSDDGIIVLETDTNEIVPDEILGYEKFNYKRYGRNILSLFIRKG